MSEEEGLEGVPAWTGAVLAGGRGRRMTGRSKPFLQGLDGRPLIETALDALRASGASHLLIGANDPERFEHLGLPVVPDAEAGRGPLAGLEAVLRAAPTEWSLIVACDMPCLEPPALRRVLAHIGPEVEAVVPLVDGRLQPLHAAYHRRAQLVLRRALEAGRLALVEVVSGLALRRVEFAPGPSFVNVNTPDELHRLSGP